MELKVRRLSAQRRKSRTVKLFKKQQRSTHFQMEKKRSPRQLRMEIVLIQRNIISREEKIFPNN